MSDFLLRILYADIVVSVERIYTVAQLAHKTEKFSPITNFFVFFFCIFFVELNIWSFTLLSKQTNLPPE